MSRPPRPYPSRATKGELLVRAGRLDYLPLEYADLVALQRALSPHAPAGGEGDFATTLFELSAMVGHVLAVYQNRYAGEAFLRTAQSSRSLVKHARRLAYEADPGLSATGFAHFTIGAGLSGTLPERLHLASAPLGERKAQDFETTESRAVDAAWNDIAVAAPDVPATLRNGDTTLAIAGTGHRLRPGEPMILVGPDVWQPLSVAAVAEDTAAGRTTLALGRPLSLDHELTSLADYELLAAPALELRLFGWDADPVFFPPDQILSAPAYVPPSSPPADPVFGYRIDDDASGGETRGGGLAKKRAPRPRAGEDAHHEDNWYLSRQLEAPLGEDYLLRRDGASAAIGRVSEQSSRNVTVTLYRASTEQRVTGVQSTTSNGVTTVVPITTPVLSEVWISGSVTRIRVEDRGGDPMPRAAQSVRSVWLTGWRTRARLVSAVPSQEPVPEGAELALLGRLTGLEPGMLVALSTRDGVVSQVVELIRVDLPAEDPSSAQVTTIVWRARTLPTVPGHVWRRGDLRVLGNVAPIVHGKTVDEVLGGSDGITPFLCFVLKKAPLTHLPGAAGGEPDLEVRVDGVRWTRVVDFGASGPDDRHYRIERDQDQITTVLFGDGVNGAVPPAGKKHIHALYRVGLGRDGNVDAGRARRMVKAHPLVEHALNPVPTAGGTPPANPEGIRLQATRAIRTFDRAVSVSDHADLALLYPGVARAAARAHDGAVELVVADADGAGISDKTGLIAFLAARRDDSVPLRLRDPEARDFYLGLYVEIDPDYVPRRVEGAVRAALFERDPEQGPPGLFTFAARKLGQPAYLSEVYALITAVPGVTFCQVTHFSFAPFGGAPDAMPPDVLRVNTHQWLRLTADHLHFTPPAEETHGA